MRYPDQSLVGDLNDGVFATISGSVANTLPTSSVNENNTVYDLLPVIINRRPDIISSIFEASTPTIQPFAATNNTSDNLYLHPDGTVKVNLGVNFKLTLKAAQPPILNVENGVPTMLINQTGLVYVWRKDGELLTSTTNNSLRSSVIVDRDTITFTNTQPEDAGTYVCEVSNDIGTTTSEPITVEVFNLDFDSYFYHNLVTNPYGEDGTTGWEANNSDLTTKTFTKLPIKDLIQPNRVDLFGYKVDMMNPRPYQIDMGAIRGFDMSKHFLGNNPSYFTRTRYKFDRKGGSFVVKAYQDIDLTDIIPIIKGGVYGIDGVRAFFSCYIGNGVTEFIPTFRGPLQLKVRTDSAKYTMSNPRISVENYLKAGPATWTEIAYVTVEEYSNETRLPTTLLQQDGTTRTQSDRVVLHDPWAEQIWSYNGAKYYNQDIYRIGELSQGDIRDATLFAADTLLPNKNKRFTYGQYAAFKKIIIDKLHPDTTKVRITLNFETTDARVFEQWKQAQDQSDEIFSVVSWEQPYEDNKWTRQIGTWQTQISTRLTRYTKKTITEAIPTAQDPHGMITGLNLALIPISKQEPEITNYYTNTTLTTNTTPTSSISGQLIQGRDYDPFGTTSTQIVTTFKYYSSGLQSNLVSQDRIEIQLGTLPPGTAANSNTPITRLPISPTNYYPFAPGSSVDFELARELDPSISTDSFNDYYRMLYDSRFANGRAPGIGPFDTAWTQRDLQNTVYALKTINNLTVTRMTSRRIPDLGAATGRVWSKRVRYTLYFSIPGTTWYQRVPLPIPVGVDGNGLTILFGSLIFNTGVTRITPALLQSYYLDVDFSGVTSKVTLSRPSTLWPGIGETSQPVELPHVIDGNGKLICTIPTNFLTQALVLGGFGYRNASPNAILGRISLVAVGPADPLSGIGSPIGGKDANGKSYIVTYAPIQDSVLNTYRP